MLLCEKGVSIKLGLEGVELWESKLYIQCSAQYVLVVQNDVTQK